MLGAALFTFHMTISSFRCSVHADEESQGWHYLSFHMLRDKTQSGEEVKPEVIHRVSGNTQPGATVVPAMRPADHLPLPQNAAAGWSERRLCRRTVLGPMLGAPTYQLRDLGQMSSPLCLSRLTSEMRTQRNHAGRALGPSVQFDKARGRCCPRGERGPTPCPGPGRPATCGHRR